MNNSRKRGNSPIAKTKNRKQKRLEYENKYKDIPINLHDRLDYMCDIYNIKEKKMEEIINKRDNMINSLFYYDLNIVVLYEEPEGAQRSRFRLINRTNFNKEAIMNPSFIHVYSPNAKDDSMFMQRIVDEGQLLSLDYMINTPCIIEYNAFIKTPNSYNITDKFLAEIGLLRPHSKKPDWDNIGKKYSDMYNYNVWLDDSMVNEGIIRKFHSILPRVEIKLRYLNAVYNKQQYVSTIARKDYDGGPLSYLDKEGGIVYET